jgi:superfamily II DNA or RNA helicase
VYQKGTCDMDRKAIIRERTRKDVINKLNKYGHVAVLRPPGFGKTWLISSFTKDYKKVLYLYPSKVIKETSQNVIYNIKAQEIAEKFDLEADEKKELEQELYFIESEAVRDNILKEIQDACKNVTFMTYMKAVSAYKKAEIDLFKGYDLIIMDELHRAGATYTMEAMRYIMDNNPDSKFIGATATPDRMDAVDVVEELFGGITTFEYTLHNAFEDEYIKRPYYCFCSYDVEKDIKNIVKEASECDTKFYDRDDYIIKSKIVEISNLFGMENIIRKTIGEVRKKEHELGHKYDTSYMKFIVFFDSISHIKDKKRDVRKWFEKAFPRYEIDELVISSANKVERNNVDKLKELEQNKKDNKIDLIYCVDMLNEGYHVDTITGVLMYRGTSSSIIFNQQFGRAFTSGDTQACIVFDIVDNIHRKNVYNINKPGNTRVCKKLTKIEQMQSIDSTSLSKSEKAELTGIFKEIGTLDIEELKGYSKRQKMIDLLDKTDFFDKNSDKSEIEIIKLIYSIANRFTDKQWWRYTNRIESEDLHPTSNYATYREILTKTLGEPIAQRCKRAGYLYFCRWCLMQDSYKYPSTKEELLNYSHSKELLEGISNSYKVSPTMVVDSILDFGEDYMKDIFEKVTTKGIENCGI